MTPQSFDFFTWAVANIVWIAILVYLLVGLFLTQNVLRAPTLKMRLRDMAIGAVVMPVLFVALLLFAFFEDMWRRLMIVLDLDPPEEMRAGPKEPAEADSKKTDA